MRLPLQKANITSATRHPYLDLSVLLERETLDTDLLAQAVKATFERRGIAVPANLPVGLTDEFAHDHSRQALWQAFIKKNELAPRAPGRRGGPAAGGLGAGVEPSRSMTPTM